MVRVGKTSISSSPRVGVSSTMPSPRVKVKRGTPRYPLERLAKIPLGQDNCYCLVSDIPTAACGSRLLDSTFRTNSSFTSQAMAPPKIGAAIGREFFHALLAAVARKPATELQSALDRLIEAGLLFRRGVPPHATYLFKHALVQDAAYGTLLREPRRTLHARIAETLESQFAEFTENQPERLARHCTEAGLVEKAAGLWGKAGLRSPHSGLLGTTVTPKTLTARRKTRMLIIRIPERTQQLWQLGDVGRYVLTNSGECGNVGGNYRRSACAATDRRPPERLAPHGSDHTANHRARRTSN